MAPQNPAQPTQRLEQIEEAVAGIRSSMMDEVAEAVNRAATKMQQTLISQITTSLDQVTQKLQVRMDRVRENNETLIAAVMKRQEDFQSEMRAMLSTLRMINNNQQGEFGASSDGLGSGARSNNFGGYGFQGNNRNRERDRNEGDSGGGGPVNTSGNWKYRKLDMPLFDGEDPDGWILRVERYFSFYRLSEEEKMEAAIVGMEGEALSWYQWEHRRRPIRVWAELRELLLKQFRPV